MGGVIIKLTNLPIRKTGTIIRVTAMGSKRRRLFDLGFIPGSKVQSIRQSPAGNPIAYLIKDTLIALRKEESDNIIIKADR